MVMVVKSDMMHCWNWWLRLKGIGVRMKSCECIENVQSLHPLSAASQTYYGLILDRTSVFVSHRLTVQCASLSGRYNQ